MVEESNSSHTSLNISPSVNNAIAGFSENEDVTSFALVEEILELHPEYANEIGSAVSLEQPSRSKQKPVSEWLEQIRELFDDNVEPQLHGRAVIIGLSRLDPELERQLQQNDFLQTLEDEYNKPLDEVLTTKPRSEPFPADSVPVQPDRPLEEQQEDKLLRTPFAKFLARRIRNATSPKAYSIHLYGPWGSGKSTLLNFLESELQEDQNLGDQEPHVRYSNRRRSQAEEAPYTGSYHVVRFNAWQHQHLEPPWWALMDNVYRQTKNELSRRNKLREVWWRVRSGRFAFFVGIAVLAWILAFAIPIILAGRVSVENLSSTAGSIGKILAVGVTVWAGIKTFTESMLVGSAQAAQSYVEYTGNPMNTIKDRFTTLINRVPKPVAIFIDDLDRCDCEYVVELLEGIQTLFTEAPVVFVVAADRQWINNCFEEVYSEQQPTVKEPGKSLGSLFLGKTFQFSTSVPTIPDHMQEEYWNILLGLEPGESLSDSRSDKQTTKAIEAAEGEEDILRAIEQSDEQSLIEQQSIREEAVERLAAPEIMQRTEHVLEPFAPLLEPNPRSMKRLVNSYSVNRALAILAYVEIDRGQLALWTILSLQFPQMAAYLEKHPEMVEKVGSENIENVDEDVASLFGNEKIIKIVNGNGVNSELTSETIESCKKIRP